MAIIRHFDHHRVDQWSNKVDSLCLSCIRKRVCKVMSFFNRCWGILLGSRWRLLRLTHNNLSLSLLLIYKLSEFTWWLLGLCFAFFMINPRWPSLNFLTTALTLVNNVLLCLFFLFLLDCGIIRSGISGLLLWSSLLHDLLLDLGYGSHVSIWGLLIFDLLTYFLVVLRRNVTSFKRREQA